MTDLVQNREPDLGLRVQTGRPDVDVPPLETAELIRIGALVAWDVRVEVNFDVALPEVGQGGLVRGNDVPAVDSRRQCRSVLWQGARRHAERRNGGRGGASDTEHERQRGCEHPGKSSNTPT